MSAKRVMDVTNNILQVGDNVVYAFIAWFLGNEDLTNILPQQFLTETIKYKNYKYYYHNEMDTQYIYKLI